MNRIHDRFCWLKAVYKDIQHSRNISPLVICTNGSGTPDEDDRMNAEFGYTCGVMWHANWCSLFTVVIEQKGADKSIDKYTN